MAIQSSFVGIMCKLRSQSLVCLKTSMAFSSTQGFFFFFFPLENVLLLLLKEHTSNSEEGFISSEDQILTQLWNDSSRHYAMDHRANTYHTAASPLLASWWPEFPALFQKPFLSFILLRKEAFKTELLRWDRMREDHFSSPAIHRLKTKWSSPSACFRGG